MRSNVVQIQNYLRVFQAPYFILNQYEVRLYNPDGGEEYRGKDFTRIERSEISARWYIDYEVFRSVRLAKGKLFDDQGQELSGKEMIFSQNVFLINGDVLRLCYTVTLQ